MSLTPIICVVHFFISDDRGPEALEGHGREASCKDERYDNIAAMVKRIETLATQVVEEEEAGGGAGRRKGSAEQ